MQYSFKIQHNKEVISQSAKFNIENGNIHSLYFSIESNKDNIFIDKNILFVSFNKTIAKDKVITIEKRNNLYTKDNSLYIDRFDNKISKFNYQMVKMPIYKIDDYSKNYFIFSPDDSKNLIMNNNILCNHNHAEKTILNIPIEAVTRNKTIFVNNATSLIRNDRILFKNIEYKSLSNMHIEIFKLNQIFVDNSKMNIFKNNNYFTINARQTDLYINNIKLLNDYNNELYINSIKSLNNYINDLYINNIKSLSNYNNNLSINNIKQLNTPIKEVIKNNLTNLTHYNNKIEYNKNLFMYIFNPRANISSNMLLDVHDKEMFDDKDFFLSIPVANIFKNDFINFSKYNKHIREEINTFICKYYKSTQENKALFGNKLNESALLNVSIDYLFKKKYKLQINKKYYSLDKSNKYVNINNNESIYRNKYKIRLSENMNLYESNKKVYINKNYIFFEKELKQLYANKCYEFFKKDLSSIYIDKKTINIFRESNPIIINKNIMFVNNESRSICFFKNQFISKDSHGILTSDCGILMDKNMHDSSLIYYFPLVSKGLKDTNVYLYNYEISKKYKDANIYINCEVDKQYKNAYIYNGINIGKNLKHSSYLSNDILINKDSKPLLFDEYITNIFKNYKPIFEIANERLKYNPSAICIKTDFHFIDRNKIGIYNDYIKFIKKKYPEIYINDFLEIEGFNRKIGFDNSKNIKKKKSQLKYDDNILADLNIYNTAIEENIGFKKKIKDGRILDDNINAIKKIKDANLFNIGFFVNVIHSGDDEDASLDSGNIDELILPHKDYKYSDFLEKLLFNNGEINYKYVTQYDKDNSEYTIKFPIENPINIYADIARDYIDLDTNILNNTINSIKNIWQANMFKYINMSAENSLKGIIVKLDAQINNIYGGDSKKLYQAYRCLQLFRWYSEMAILNNCEYILNFDTKKIAVDYYNKTLGELEDMIVLDNMHISDNYIMEPIDCNKTCAITFLNRNQSKQSAKLQFKLYNINCESNIYIIEEETTVKELEYNSGIHDLKFDLKDRIMVRFIPTKKNQSINMANISIDGITTRGFTVKYKGKYGETNAVMQDLLDKMLVVGEASEELKAKLGDVAPVTVAVNTMIKYFELHDKDKQKGKRLITKK